MLFFKPKSSSIDIIPPPLPSRTGFKEAKKDTIETIFSQIPSKALKKPELKPHRVIVTPSADDKLDDLMKEMGIATISEKESAKTEKQAPAKKQNIAEKIGIVPLKETTPLKKAKKPAPIKQTIKAKEKGKKAETEIALPVELHDLDKELGFEKFDLDLPEPKFSKKKKEIELPETLGELGMEETHLDFDINSETNSKEPQQQTKIKPNEILEAEEEIKTAIQKIKENEKPSIFRRLFAGKPKQKPQEDYLVQTPEVDEVSIIESNIKNAREALMKLDLEAARQNYIELMKVYNNIKPEEQAKVYNDIRELYFERKSAEQLKV